MFGIGVDELQPELFVESISTILVFWGAVDRRQCNLPYIRVRPLLAPRHYLIHEIGADAFAL